MKAKKNLLLALGCIIVSNVLAQGKDVVWRPDGDLDINSGHNHIIPNVSTDGDDVNLKCDSTLYNVDVVIKDQYGNVMHQSTQTIGPSETTIYVPSTDGDSEKTTIDLYYDRRHLSCYFEE